ncbi:hypothetical protein BDQ12DRAFT_721382 [Crucibulum laeve]|uniref:Uncharacterized protein n=1 Tax=Crucibulum laeve TaxID=68775 RepID=A0A5C3M7W6_9AGAR|nr:hypothetical protein BDQ12DRAFT_721382 [Crucibulum laeve]
MSGANESQRPDGPVRETVTDPTTEPVVRTTLPSEVVKPTRSDTVPQQGSTQPGDGSEVHAGPQVPFKEQVIGISQKTRGTITGNKGLKEHGEAILEGKASFFAEKEAEKNAKP